MSKKRNHCPACGLPRATTRYTLTTQSICRNPSCPEYKTPVQSHVDLWSFLDLSPYTKQQFSELPPDTPIWLEYRWQLNGICCNSDIFITSTNTTATFAISDPLSLADYGTFWRAWPTFKTFRPDRYAARRSTW